MNVSVVEKKLMIFFFPVHSLGGDRGSPLLSPKKLSQSKSIDRPPKNICSLRYDFTTMVVGSTNACFF